MEALMNSKHIKSCSICSQGNSSRIYFFGTHQIGRQCMTNQSITYVACSDNTMNTSLRFLTIDQLKGSSSSIVLSCFQSRLTGLEE
ncbi:hypothetical protein BLOT_014860 [Blomia tropicalis]|nr:hypothetical protein BLOT_014860 [Blomia tropicalis]